jgi:hypothetical protein
MRDLEYIRRVNRNPRGCGYHGNKGDKLGANSGQPEALKRESALARASVRDDIAASVGPGRNVFVRESDCGLVREVAAILNRAHEETASGDLDPHEEARRAAP